MDDFIVLGEKIDQELREKIREAVMSTHGWHRVDPTTLS